MATHSSILENPLDKGACRATVHRVTKSQRPLKQLSTHAHTRIVILGFSAGSVVKNLPASAEDTGSIPESGRYLGEENGNPIQYFCMANLIDRGA